MRVILPNGWALTAVGKNLPLGDLPLNMAVSRTGKLLAVTNNGQSQQSIQLFDARAGKQLDEVVAGKCWYGLKFSSDEKRLYASGGNDNWILQYRLDGGKLFLEDSILLGKKWPVEISPAGIEIDDQQQILYVVTKDNNSLYVKKRYGGYRWVGKPMPVNSLPTGKPCSSVAGDVTVCWCTTRRKHVLNGKYRWGITRMSFALRRTAAGFL